MWFFKLILFRINANLRMMVNGEDNVQVEYETLGEMIKFLTIPDNIIESAYFDFLKLDRKTDWRISRLMDGILDNRPNLFKEISLKLGVA